MSKQPARDRRTRRAGHLAELGRIAGRALAMVDPFEGLKQYRDNPVAFCRDVIGFEPWEGQQRVMRALAAHQKVTVPAGRMVGKSRLGGAMALWFVATRPGSCVVLTAPTARQVQEVLWHEIRQLVRTMRVQIGIHCADRASTGAKTAGGSRILGITSELPEGFQGIRDPEMLIIPDEASRVPDSIFDVINGNLPDGGSLLLLGNPTRAEGYFRESFRHDPYGQHGKVLGERFVVVHLPSTSSPNVLQHRTVFPGLAGDEWLSERAREWGKDSPTFRMHVLGEVSEGVEGRLFSVELIAGAEAAWPDTPATGRLVIGLDPAGEGGEKDESAFCCRRGKKVTHMYQRRGLSPEGHLTELLGCIVTQKGDSQERPIILVDREGEIGYKVFVCLSGYQSLHPTAFELWGVRSSDQSSGGPKRPHDRKRDAMWFNLVDALRAGVAIPEDLKLERELAEIHSEQNAQGKSKITPKTDLRKALGRSPDRADALCLACWNFAKDDVDLEQTSMPKAQSFTHEPTHTGRPEIDPRQISGMRAFDIYGNGGRRR